MVLSDPNVKKQEFLMNHILFNTAYYLNDFHINKRFHGDLKPQNIFFEDITHEIYTDCGTVKCLE